MPQHPKIRVQQQIEETVQTEGQGFERRPDLPRAVELPALTVPEDIAEHLQGANGRWPGFGL